MTNKTRLEEPLDVSDKRAISGCARTEEYVMSQDVAEVEAGNNKYQAEPGVSYEIGYGRPPKAYNFKKGQSGNPAGAPKRKTLNMQSALENALSGSVSVRANGKERRMNALEAMIFTQMQSALRGNIGAVRRVMRLAKKTDRWSDPRKLVGVIRVEDPESELSKITAEYRAAIAAGEDPWKKYGLDYPVINVTKPKE
jgi:hypothetical protein